MGNEQVFPFQMRDVNQTERMHFVRKVSSLRRRSRRRRQIVFAFPTTSPESKSYLVYTVVHQLVGESFRVFTYGTRFKRKLNPASLPC